MGQFKPMVKMETTEPSVELKLKKGGEVKMQTGGRPPMRGPSMPARGGALPAAAPLKPSMAARRRAMMAMPAGAAPAGPVGRAGRMMKDGGDTLAEHAAKPASKAHKGLKTGGVANAQGGYATGGVAKANGGGYMKGGAAKKAYATGGRVDSGAPVAMPQGRKAPPKPVSINRLSGTYKGGGKVDAYDEIKGMDIPKGAKAALQQAENEKAYKAFEADQSRPSRSLGSMLSDIPKAVRGLFDRKPASGAVTKTEKSVTVEPAKKRGGPAC